MLTPRHQAQLQRLRGFRAKVAPNLSLDADYTRQAAELKRMARGLGPLATAWAEIVPGGLAARTALVGVSRGTLTVRVEDSGTLHELDRHLRAGGEERLIRRSSIAIRRVKLVV